MSATKQPSMTAPASTAYKIIDVPDPYKELIARRGVRGTYVGAREDESPWVPFGSNAAIRHLAFDVRNNVYCNILWMKSGGVVGTHRHRGTVIMVCLEGSARYLEYEWVATPGDFITEAPGETHTLVSDHPDGVKLFGWLQGATDYFDENGNYVETLDIWWFMNHYETYCRENGMAINEQLYI